MPFQMRKSNWIWLCVFIMLFIFPAVADSCPFCAGQDNKFSDILLPVALLLGAPFAVAGVFIAVIVKHNKTEQKESA